VKISRHEKEKRVFLDIGLQGISRKEISKEVTFFGGLKFLSTSYYHKVRLIINP